MKQGTKNKIIIAQSVAIIILTGIIIYLWNCAGTLLEMMY